VFTAGGIRPDSAVGPPRRTYSGTGSFYRIEQLLFDDIQILSRCLLRRGGRRICAFNQSRFSAVYPLLLIVFKTSSPNLFSQVLPSSSENVCSKRAESWRDVHETVSNKNHSVIKWFLIYEYTTAIFQTPLSSVRPECPSCHWPN